MSTAKLLATATFIVLQLANQSISAQPVEAEAGGRWGARAHQSSSSSNVGNHVETREAISSQGLDNGNHCSTTEFKEGYVSGAAVEGDDHERFLSSLQIKTAMLPPIPSTLEPDLGVPQHQRRLLSRTDQPAEPHLYFTGNDEQFERLVEELGDQERNSIGSDPLNYVARESDMDYIIKLIDALQSTGSPEGQADWESVAAAKETERSGIGHTLECPICLAQIESSLEKVLDCGHRMHEDCAKSWSLNDANNWQRRLEQVICPLCRQASAL